MRTLHRVIALGLASSLCLSTASAPLPQWAPPPPPPTPPPGMPGAPPGTVPLHLRGDMVGLQYQLVMGDGTPVRSCNGDCTIYIYPGRYRLMVEETDETRAGKKDIDVYGPTVANVSPGSKSQRTAGLVMGIVGPVCIVVGLFGWLLTAVDNFDRSGKQRDATPYVVLLFGGMGMTTGGWIMFGTSGTKIKPERVASKGSMFDNFAFGAVPTKNGFVLGGSMAF